jgi:ring-1,2-phenylacetyl-CoA epoxidase subunit PaaC
MTPDLTDALTAKLLALADDEYLLGHRDSEWTGHAPILEEDIAFANIALDELGHAILWYEAIEALTGDAPDRLAFFREAAAFRNAQLCELPKGDWAFTIVRQYVFDAAELVRLAGTLNSAYRPMAEISAQIQPEEIYHDRHTSNWVRRLGLGTSESHTRMQAALDSIWPYALQLFVPLPDEDRLAAAGIVPDPAQTRADWEARVRPWLAESGLSVPQASEPVTTDRQRHTEHLAALITEMQEVARTEDPGVGW